MSAGFALVRFFTSVNTLVNFQIWLLREVFPAVLAFELLRSLVILADVTFQISPARKLDTTEGTLGCASELTVLVSHVLVEGCLPPASEVALLALEIFATVVLLCVLP